MTITAELKEWLQANFTDQLKLDEPLSGYTSLGVGGPADALISVQDPQQLQKLVGKCRQSSVPYFVLAGGTNLLIKDAGIRGVVIDIKHGLKKISSTELPDGRVEVMAQAGSGLQMLCRYALDRDLIGLNFALGIPGTVGGAVMMNAGTVMGDMAEVVISVELLTPAGEIVVKSNEQLNFSYRRCGLMADGSAADKSWGSPVIVSALFLLKPGDPASLRSEANEFLKSRIASQPRELPSAGCFFKNPSTGATAGQLIDQAGLKGEAVGGASVSEKHANFVVNSNRATAADMLSLMDIIHSRVAAQHGIELESEVKIVGE